MKNWLLVLVIMLGLGGCVPRGIPIELYSEIPRTSEELQKIEEEKMLSTFGDDRHFIKAMTIEPLPWGTMDITCATTLYAQWKKTEYATINDYINKTNALGLRTDIIDSWYLRVLDRAEMLRKVK